MITERLQRRIDAFLDQAEGSADRSDRVEVAAKVRAVLALNERNADGLRLVRVAKSSGGGPNIMTLRRLPRAANAAVAACSCSERLLLLRAVAPTHATVTSSAALVKVVSVPGPVAAPRDCCARGLRRRCTVPSRPLPQREWAHRRARPTGRRLTPARRALRSTVLVLTPVCSAIAAAVTRRRVEATRQARSDHTPTTALCRGPRPLEADTERCCRARASSLRPSAVQRARGS